ncbi:MAG: phosphoribosylamine--glycine ligase [Clostridiales bacterium]|jgi:phosphoribosylamine--glycine ligase|nr:phosphoribosylamine--glycine ligase [Clostridiales bacterium]
MRILVIGGGGREHAICWALAKSKRVTRVYCAPGNAGTAQVAQNVDIGSTDTAELIAFAKNVGADMTICPMEEPLVAGIVDDFTAAGLLIFGPTKAAAEIEGSKVYSKDFMRRYNIPTAEYGAFDSFRSAMAHCAAAKFPLVVKVDGLAAGKGVIICQNMEAAEKALLDIFENKKFGAAGDSVVIEEYLDGVECSVLAFCDGKTLVPMPGAKDHKAAYDKDMGPNTGGMGVVTPNPYYNEETSKECMEKIFLPTMEGLRKDGREFVGVLFFGLMLTAEGPKLLEYNCRPGDPEIQALLPLLETDLVNIILACLDRNLDNMEIIWKNNAICCVMAASEGYPGEYSTGYPIWGLDDIGKDVLIFHSGTKKVEDKIVTAGGRVFCVTASADNLEAARAAAYDSLKNMHFSGMRYRADIGDLGAAVIN